MLNLSLTQILILVPTILIALTIHELSHAAAALALGDDTAREAGRITINPLKHIDPFGFIMIVVVGFGWAKPVHFSVEKLRKPIRDEILIAFAGPLSNLLLAFLATVVLKIVDPILPYGDPDSLALSLNIFSIFIATNIGLALFNALPIPPLDGSHLYLGFLAKHSSQTAQLFARYGFLILVGVIVAERILDVEILRLGQAIDAVFGLMLRIVGW